MTQQIRKASPKSTGAGDAGSSPDVMRHRQQFKKGEPAARFQLTDQQGKQFDSATLKGKVWMASVFFANCPGPCFRENQAIADILREIDDPNFIAVSLTCDPDNDTPAALAHYADRFEADSAAVEISYWRHGRYQKSGHEDIFVARRNRSAFGAGSCL